MDVTINDDEITVDLSDGRTIIVPLAWYPRLQHATAKERRNWRLIASGEGIHWTDLDEDASVKNLLPGQPSGESQESLKRWLDAPGGAKAEEDLMPDAHHTTPTFTQ